MKTRSFLAFIFFVSVIWSCNSKYKYVYPEDNSISQENGFTNSDKALYFPLEWIYSQYKSKKEVYFIDSSSLSRKTSLYKAFKEPILYNYYLDKDVYRLTWIRSFEPDICISIEKQGETVYLIEKKFLKPFSTQYYSTDSIDDNGKTILIRIPKDTTLEVNSRSEISIEIWNKFENLIEESQLDTLKPFDLGIPISDGYSWIFEIHKKDKYYMVDRQLGGDIREIGNFMIEQTEFKEINN